MRVAVLCLVAFLACVAVLSKADSLHNIEQFAEGFALGLESDLNFTTCLPDAEKTFQLLDSAVHDLEDGFASKNIATLYKGFEELGDGIKEFGLAFKECGEDFAELAADIERIAEQLQKPYGIVEVIIKEAITIWHHRHDFTADVKNFISSWKSGNFKQAGFDLGVIVGILLEE